MDREDKEPLLTSSDPEAARPPRSSPRSRGRVRQHAAHLGRLLPARRMYILLLAVVFFAMGYVIHAPISSATADTVRYWTSPRFQRAVRIRVFNELLQERYPWREQKYRQRNFDSLERLATCTNLGTCNESEEQIVILASFHFGNSLHGHTSGEDIWAASVMMSYDKLNITTLIAYNDMETLFMYQAFPDLIPIIIWEASILRWCIDRNETNFHEHDVEKEAHGEWQHGQHACIQTPKFPTGIPLWKSMGWTFWTGEGTPLGHEWSLAPENYAAMDEKHTGNHYLGYTIEQRCMKAPYFEVREHRAIVLAKQPFYFEEEHSAWYHMLEGVKNQVPELMVAGEDPIKFNIISTAGHEVSEGNPPDVIDEPGVQVIGRLKQDQWIQTVGRSKVMIGIGKPPVSPSPFDALCCGVPFINPILRWKEDDPDNRLHWETQANGLKFEDPPYVYNVRKGDYEGLAEAIKQAVATPIERYVPAPMRMDAVIDRHLELVTADWLGKCRQYVHDEYSDRPEVDTSWWCMDPPDNRNKFELPGHEGEKRPF